MAEATADVAVHVVSRTTGNDGRPAKQAGLRALWPLRGEAPPTVEQPSEPDTIAMTSSGVPNAVVSIAPERIPVDSPRPIRPSGTPAWRREGNAGRMVGAVPSGGDMPP